ncbi:acyltransferase family protein [Zeaxanthinibacter enoshimensis]|uniref:Putative acyltransferase n=1 Tax=Zeaxanthinibacter enoshimensis TaxID=392009 RepID=A0A4R6TRD9_9FLAO|nr:heparan-alpha-glucosaminide N-acetyltransferase domain-containing protein [Zeaxanthinibacter enoshimensis]TDQ32877.1 putative acyltransferase [Zeaxanthinibacter enoshimensis]
MKERIVSVDIFRGLTIALMILVNTPGNWEHVYGPFLHAPWHGYTPTDLVFPFFLFIVGTSIVLAYRNRRPDASTVRKISVRSLKLIGLGLFLGAFTLTFPFFKDFEDIRFPGVLQRIGIVFFFAALLYLYTNWRVILAVSIIILLGYWVWLGYIPLEGGSPTYERAANNWTNYIDLNVLGTHMYKEDYDPEGILSTFPALVTALLGIFTGRVLISARPSKVITMVIMGVVMLAAGYLWDVFFPINKALWTSSYVLVTAGWANLLLALIYYLTDVRGLKFGSIFRYAGANAITIYFLSSFFTKIFYLVRVGENNSLHGWLYKTVFVYESISMKTSSLLYGLTVTAFYLLIAYLMYKRNIFIKV